MMTDALLLFSDAQAVTATAASTNYIDLGPLTAPGGGANLIRDIGAGERVFLHILCTVAMTDGSSDSTVTVSWETDDNTSFSSVATVFSVPVFAALTAAGTERIVALPPGSYERYNQLKYTVANGNLTTGSFTSRIVKDVQNWRAYDNAYTVA